MSEAPKEKPILDEKRRAQLAQARIKAAETIQKNKLAREQKRIEAAKQQLLEQGFNTPMESPIAKGATTTLNTKDPVEKQAKWDARKREIVQEVHERMKTLGIPHRNDPKSRKKKPVKAASLSPTTSEDEESASDSESEESVDDDEPVVMKKPVKKTSSKKQQPPKKQLSEHQLLRLY